MKDATKTVKKRSVFARFFGIVADPKAYAAVAYMLFALLSGAAYFSLAVTGVSLSVGLSILIIGVPIALLFLGLVRGVSFAEGRLIETLLGVKMPETPRPTRVERSIVQRALHWLKDRRTWTSLAYMVAQLPLGVLYFTFVTFWIALAITLMFYPVAQILLGWPLTYDGYSIQFGFWSTLGLAGLGALLFTVFMHAAKGIGRIHGNYAKAFLVGEQR